MHPTECIPRVGLTVLFGGTDLERSVCFKKLLLEAKDRFEKVMAVEAHVTDTISGVMKSPVGLSWRSSIMSALHSDPDVLGIGDFEAVECADLAIQAAMSGVSVLVMSARETQGEIMAFIAQRGRLDPVVPINLIACE